MSRRGRHIIKGFEKVFESLTFQEHLDNESFPPTALRSPVTEVAMFYFPSDISDDAKTVASETMAKFKSQSLDQCADVQAANFGFGVENNFPVPGGEEGQKASALTILIGWPSVDAHMKFRETEAFQKGSALLKTLENVIKVQVVHVKCKILENEVRRRP